MLYPGLLVVFFALCSSSAYAEIRQIHGLKMGGSAADLDAAQWILAGAPPSGWKEQTRTDCRWELTHPGDTRDLIDPACAVRVGFQSEGLARQALSFFRQTGYAISVGQDADLGEPGYDESKPIRWTERQVRAVIEAVSGLPEHHKKLKWMRCFFVSRTMRPGMSVSYLQDSAQNIPAAVVFSADFDDPKYDRTAHETIVHEMGHIWTYHHGRKGWDEAASGSGYVTDYARQSAVEDFAESFSFYRYRPDVLKSVAPRKYEYLRSRVFKGIEYLESR